MFGLPNASNPRILPTKHKLWMRRVFNVIRPLERELAVKRVRTGVGGAVIPASLAVATFVPQRKRNREGPS